ncbi:MAG: hypothetical protein JF615_06210 [Asticcacaulis sp.]|nr:hypothetical protein [Asticcacaulis sp.]
MKSITLAAVLLLALAACSPAPKPAATAASSAAAVATFTVGTVTQDDTDIQGCTTMLGKTDDGLDYVFLEDAADTGAKGYMKIDGKITKVDLKSSTSDEGTSKSKRLFASPNGHLSVVEDLVMGDQHPDSDSVDLTGRLTVTYNNMIQTIPVKGGTAC